MSNSQKYLIVVGGPTASGKTALSIELAKYFQAPIISADSRQFYREMRIGNARPNPEQLKQAPHLFVADRSVEETLSAGTFAKEAWRFLENHFRDHDYAIAVGGSGLFLKALTEGLNNFPDVSKEVRGKVDQLFAEKGLEGLQEALLEADPDYFRKVDQNNPARLKRALEVCYAGDKPFSYYRSQTNALPSFIPIYLLQSWPREQLYDRINKRVEEMILEGLEGESRALEEFRHLSSLKTVGYQEWFPYFDGEYSRERAVELIKQNSRRYAKRQMTWFRRDAYWKHVFKGDLRTALTYIHLVQTERLALVSNKNQALPEGASSHLKMIQTCLGDGGENDPMGRVVLLKKKEFGWLKDWQWSSIGHMGQAVIMHENLYRSECKEVYAFSNKTQLEQFGFCKISKNMLPTWIKTQAGQNDTAWLWEQKKQQF